MQTFDPTKLSNDALLSRALRQVSKHWPLAYSKLLSLEWRWSDATPYGATDGRELILNPAGINKLQRQPNGVGLCAFLLVHESLHALLGHGWRLAKMRDPKCANVAADYIINAMIKARNKELGKAVFPLIDGVLLNEELSGDKSVEQLYRELQQPAPPTKPKAPEPKQDENKDDNEGEDNDDDEGAAGDGEGEDNDAAESEEDDTAGLDTGGDTAADDDGSDTADGGTDSGSADSLDDFVGTGAEDTYKPIVGENDTDDSVAAKMEEDNDRLLLADHIERAGGGDSGMTGTRVMQQRVLPQPMPWAELLHEWLRGSSRSGWSSPFNAPVHGSTGLVCCGRRKRSAGDIVLVIDTSGSVPARVYDRFLKEAHTILQELRPERLHLLSVSHYVCEAVTLERGDDMPLSLKGGGGTAFQPAFDWVQCENIQPDVLVYLTDGVAYDINSLQAPDYPVLWVSTLCQPEHYPFGDTIMTTDFN